MILATLPGFLNLSIKLFGTEPWALRIVSGIFGTLTVLGLYLLTKQLFNKESVALLSSFFLATSFWHINFSRIGFRAIMAPAFLVWSLFLLFKIVNQTKKNWLLPILAGFIFGLGFHSYIAYRIAPILLIPPFILLIKNKKIKLKPTLREKRHYLVLYIETSKDLKTAKIFVSIFPESDEKNILESISKKIPELNKFIGSKIKTKFLPHLEIEIDKQGKAERKIEEILSAERPNGHSGGPA